MSATEIKAPSLTFKTITNEMPLSEAFMVSCQADSVDATVRAAKVNVLSRLVHEATILYREALASNGDDPEKVDGAALKGKFLSACSKGEAGYKPVDDKAKKTWQSHKSTVGAALEKGFNFHLTPNASQKAMKDHCSSVDAAADKALEEEHGDNSDPSTGSSSNNNRTDDNSSDDSGNCGMEQNSSVPTDVISQLPEDIQKLMAEIAEEAVALSKHKEFTFINGAQKEEQIDPFKRMRNVLGQAKDVLHATNKKAMASIAAKVSDKAA